MKKIIKITSFILCFLNNQTYYKGKSNDQYIWYALNFRKIKFHGKNKRNKTYPYHHFEQQAREWGISTEIDKHGKQRSLRNPKKEKKKKPWIREREREREREIDGGRNARRAAC
jgi:hypothetical protein